MKAYTDANLSSLCIRLPALPLLPFNFFLRSYELHFFLSIGKENFGCLRRFLWDSRRQASETPHIRLFLSLLRASRHDGGHPSLRKLSLRVIENLPSKCKYFFSRLASNEFDMLKPNLLAWRVRLLWSFDDNYNDDAGKRDGVWNELILSIGQGSQKFKDTWNILNYFRQRCITGSSQVCTGSLLEWIF